MKEKNKSTIFYIIIISMVFAGTLYMVHQKRSSAAAIEQVKEEITLKDVAVVCLLSIVAAVGIYFTVHHIYYADKPIKFFFERRIRDLFQTYLKKVK